MRHWVLWLFALVALASPAGAIDVGGCECLGGATCEEVSYTDIPSNGNYYFTTFAGGGAMACGGVADGSWPYMAGSARFGCGAKVRIDKNGQSCVALVTDCGPNKCIEQALTSSGCGAHVPTIGASPFIAQHLTGASSVGWSENVLVTAMLVDDSSTIGCPGVAVPYTGNSGGSGGAGGAPPNECAPPVCSCGSCFEDCMCDVADAAFCADSCGTEPQQGTAGSGSASSAPEPNGCTGAPDCGGCGSCYDQCRCEYKSDAACKLQCGKADQTAAPGPMSAKPDDTTPVKPSCAARVAGREPANVDGVWLLLALSLLRRCASSSRRARR